ncbi:TerC family protein [Rickettsiales endosymbiont of Stachyamoeba lipophora]|uniref:TerC family protein n=1 Tax=Rickettsiales endosymbiont of Stachyamoeba lipophora TaxID=2486578 RepID=UPI000F64604D|nr:hypothetical protein [Rickettsiales endosymbiont of Stachyamoeba lipophora]AZL16015.1 hypothetical protein EF513_05625 [Rickettsiales endosymbiont of Stachyamoeba lipophora]
MLEILTFSNLLNVLTLVFLEVILGIDNAIYLSLSYNNLTLEERKRLRRISIITAVLSRVALLFVCYFICHLNSHLFIIANFNVTTKTILYLLLGGVLVIKAISEIYDIKFNKVVKLVKTDNDYRQALIQIGFINFILALDSAATAMGLTEYLTVALIALIASLTIVLLAKNKIKNFIYNNLAIKVLSLSGLLVIGLFMIIKAIGFHINLTNLYFAILFGMVVEFIKMIVLREQK